MGENYMEEWEALIQRRKMLLENVSKINHEVEKIDQRLDFLGRTTVPE
jgi:ubiquinone biosynthesis protein UbiJ